MRYSFHGKVRATGQPVDGFVEAPNSTLAIDRLADRGIIGVYTVRPEPKPPKNSVRLDGDKSPEPDDEKPAPRLEAPAPAPAPVKAEPGAEVVFSSLVEKLGSLLVQVEKLLARPPQQQVIYQTGGPARERGSSHDRPRRSHHTAESNSTLRDIFQTNLDLRQSLEKLASNTGTASRMSEAVAKVTDAANRLTEAAVESTDAAAAHEESNAETPAPMAPSAPREPSMTRELAQPAA